MAVRTLALAVTALVAFAGPDASAQAPPASQAPARPPQGPVYTARGPRVNEDARLMAEFEARVKAYSTLHRKLESTLPDVPKSSTPQQVDGHQVGLAQLMAKARAGAQPGDIFTKDTRALYRRSLHRVFSGPQGARLRAAIMDENPGRIRLTINGHYPDALPVVTVPSQVLQALPKLPEELEYRFVGETLVLLDIHAHIVVDFIDSAIPK